MKAASKKKRIIKEDLSSLINKFSQNDVIAEMEKEYANRPTLSIPASEIDDVPFLKRAKIPSRTLSHLAESIEKHGILTPLIVRPKLNHYELILGRKRFHGGKKAHIKEFPCIIMDNSDEEVLLMLLADVRDQKGANVVEMALIFEALAKNYGYRQKTLADLSHQSRSQITNTLRILTLPYDVIDEISLGALSYGHAKAIASLSEEEIHRLVNRIHEENLSVREVEEIAKAGREKKNDDSDLPKYGIVKIKQSKKSITLRFENEEDKEKFLKTRLYK